MIGINTASLCEVPRALLAVRPDDENAGVPSPGTDLPLTPFLPFGNGPILAPY